MSKILPGFNYQLERFIEATKNDEAIPATLSTPNAIESSTIENGKPEQSLPCKSTLIQQTDESLSTLTHSAPAQNEGVNAGSVTKTSTLKSESEKSIYPFHRCYISFYLFYLP